jgi:predicted ATPase
MVEQVAGGRPLPKEVMDQIIAKTDGVPLFVEELTRAVLEAGILVEDLTGYQLQRPLPPLAVPATLHDSLMARLDRLSPGKEIAQISAVIGREFPYALLRAVVNGDEEALRSAIATLEAADLLLRSADSDDVARPNRDDAATWFRDDVARCTGMISPTGAWPAGRRFLTFRP